MDEVKRSDQIIKIPDGLESGNNSLGASVFATCSDWCAEQCGTSVETGGCQDCKTSCEYGCQSGQGCGTTQCSQCGTCQSSQCGACESSSQTVYTAPTFTISNITETGCDVNVRPGSGYVKYRVFARLTSDPNDKSYDWTFTTSSAFTATMNSLQPRTSYTVNVCGVIDTVSDKWAGAKTFTTSGKTRPANWSWWPTVAAGQPINLSADEWNAFCDRIDAFRIYTGRDPWPSYKTVRSGTPISAAVVNEARAAINPMGPTAAIPKYINPNDPITADYFNSLKDFLNSVP